MRYYLTWYFVWKILGIAAAGGVVYCLLQISPWAIPAVFAAALVKVLDELGEHSFKEYEERRDAAKEPE